MLLFGENVERSQQRCMLGEVCFHHQQDKLHNFFSLRLNRWFLSLSLLLSLSGFSVGDKKVGETVSVPSRFMQSNWKDTIIAEYTRCQNWVKFNVYGNKQDDICSCGTGGRRVWTENVAFSIEMRCVQETGREFQRDGF